jgi:spoIIIJ-associated protein
MKWCDKLPVSTGEGIVLDSLERTGKTVEEATNDALKALGITAEEADITVLESGTKGFIGIGGKPAKVYVKKKLTPAQVAKAFLKEVTLAMGLFVTIETEMTDRQMNIEMKGDTIGILIGKHGQTLDSLQYLVNLIVNKGDAPYISVVLDTENYRRRRKESLEALAHNLASKAKTTRRKVILEPMTPYERRIIHASLQGDRNVDTFSEGDEQHRYVVITPKVHN